MGGAVQRLQSDKFTSVQDHRFEIQLSALSGWNDGTMMIDSGLSVTGVLVSLASSCR